MAYAERRVFQSSIRTAEPEKSTKCAISRVHKDSIRVTSLRQVIDMGGTSDQSASSCLLLALLPTSGDNNNSSDQENINENDESFELAGDMELEVLVGSHGSRVEDHDDLYDEYETIERRLSRISNKRLENMLQSLNDREVPLMHFESQIEA